MTDLNIRHGLSSQIFNDDGSINKKLVIEEGSWYLCTDTVELFLGVNTSAGLTLKRINDPAVTLPVEDLILKSEIPAIKQEVVQTVKPDVEEIKTKVEEEILPKVETVETLRAWIENKDYLQDIDIENLAPISYVDEQITKIVIPEIPTKISSFVNDKNYISEIPAEYITETELNAKNYLTEHQSLTNYATKTYVENVVAENQPNLAKFALKSDIPDVSGFITSVPEEYVTESELRAKGYASENYVDSAITNIKVPSIDLSSYYTKAETDEALYEAIAEIEHPVIDLSKYAFKSEVNLKANEIPFTTSKIVTNTVGNFTVGDDVKGLQLTEIIAKLLGLTDGAAPEPEGVIEEIIAYKIPMYAVTAEGQLAEIPYTYIKLTVDAAAEIATTSGFYQIIDSTGKVIESGYQEMQAYSDSTYYVIALPKAIDYNTMVSIQSYNALNKIWESVEKFNLTSDPAEVAFLCEEAGIDISQINTDTYTIWALGDCPTGSKLRYIITEENN